MYDPAVCDQPGRDTAPGFLLRRRRCCRRQFWGNEPMLLKCNTWRSDFAIQVTIHGTESCDGPSVAAARAVHKPEWASPEPDPGSGRSRTVSSRHLCCSAVRDGPFALPSVIDPFFGA